MDERELLRLWEKTIPGGDLAGLPANVTYRPPEPTAEKAPEGASPPKQPEARPPSGPTPIASAPRSDDPGATIATPGPGSAIPESGSYAALEPTAPPPSSRSSSGGATGAVSKGGSGPGPAASGAALGATLPPAEGVPSIATRTGPGTRSGGVFVGPPQDPVPTAHTSFELLDEIGRGGMGVVFRARQESLAREVALKRIIPGKGGAPERQQFLAEALVTGALDHPNVVPIHDLGRTPDGELFLAMKLVNGASWRDLLHPRTDGEREKAKKLDQTAHVRLLLEVSNAVAFAHTKGIVHRDLKPENVMVGDFGEVLVMDWGIAVDVREKPGAETARAPHHLSVTTPAGTPCYMPPELAIGRGREIGPATDIYLLGAILHEIVTGAPPHRGETLVDVLTAAIRSEPEAYGPEVPAALRAILHRAMAKEPRDRYPDVRSFREALERYLANRESVKISDAAEATLAACLGGTAGAPAEAAAPGTGGAVVAAIRDRNRRYAAFAEAVAGFNQAILLWPENEAARSGARRARIAFARAALEAEDLGLADAQAGALPPGDQEGALLKVEIASMAAARERAARMSRRLKRGLMAAVAAIIVGLVAGYAVVSKERNHAIDESWRGKLEMAYAFYERALGFMEKGKFQSADACALRAVEYAPRREIPSAYAPVWPSPGWPDWAWRLHRAIAPLCATELLRFSGEPATFTAIAVGPMGKHALLGDDEGRVRVYEMATGKLLRTIPSSACSPVASIALSPGHAEAAVLTEDGTLRLVAPGEGRELGSLSGAAGGFSCAAIAPGGRVLLAGGSDRSLWLFDVPGRKALWHTSAGAQKAASAIAFSPDGTRALVGFWDGSARLFDVESGRELTGKDLKYPDVDGGVTAAVFERSGELAWLGSGNGEGALRRVEVATGRERTRVTIEEDIRGIVLSPDARTALILLAGGGVEVHALDRGEKCTEIELGADTPAVFAPSADGTLALVAFEGGPPRLFDLTGALQRPHPVAQIDTRKDRVDSLAISSDGRLVLGACESGAVRLWELGVGNELFRLLGHTGCVKDVSISPDARLGASAGSDGTARIWDLVKGVEVRRLEPGCGAVQSVVFRSDGAALLLACEGAVVLFEVATGRELRRLTAPGCCFSCARLGADGRSVVVGSAHAVFRYDLESRAEPLRLEGDPAGVNGVDITADGKLAVAACDDKAVRVWRCDTGELLRRIEVHSGAVSDLALLPDGRTLVSGSKDRTLGLVDIEIGKVLRRMSGNASALSDVAVSGDGAIGLTASEAGSVFFYPLVDPTIPNEPPDDLDPIYRRIGFRVAKSGRDKNTVVPYGAGAK